VFGTSPLRAGATMESTRLVRHAIGKIELLSVRQNEDARDHLQMPFFCRDPLKHISRTNGKTPGKTTHTRHDTLLTPICPFCESQRITHWFTYLAV